MSLPIYQRVAVTDAGDVIPGAEYTVINENTGVAAPIYSDRTGATLLSAPYFADSVGTIQFFIAAGTNYRVAASGGVGTYTDRYVYAAYAQESENDATAGRLMATGAGGLVSSGVPSANISTTGGNNDGTGFLSVSTGAVGIPSGASRGGVLKFGYAGSERSMLYSDPLNSQIHIRHRFSAVADAWGQWYKIFHTGNILGPVSQSSGLATGAIIQRGANSNGEFVRFADGTQICTLYDATAVSVAVNATLAKMWTFPVSFLSKTSYSITGTNRPEQSEDYFGFTYSNNSNEATATLHFKNGATTAQNMLDFRYIAIGRWI